LAQITPTVITQIFLMALLALGYLRYRSGDLRGHGLILVAATIIHYASVILQMIPVLLSEYPYFTSAPLASFTLLNVAHDATGGVAMILAAYISARWLANGLNPKGCMGKNLMRVTIITWAASLLIGLIIHLTT